MLSANSNFPYLHWYMPHVKPTVPKMQILGEKIVHFLPQSQTISDKTVNILIQIAELRVWPEQSALTKFLVSISRD